MSSGLWAVLSKDNFRGKSSLLNIAEATLRSNFSTEVKPDVWGWLSLVQLDFWVDASPYRNTLEKTAGEKDPRLAQATLARLDGDEWFRIRTGPADKGFEDAVADNMMEEFGFAKFQAFNKDQGSHTHGWNSIAASMFVNGPGKAVFAEVHNDGVSLRLLQLFMGLPWVTTYTAATTALKMVTADREPDKAAAPGANRLSARLAGLEAELVEARKANDRRNDRVELRRRLVVADLRLVTLQARVSEGRDAEAALTRQVSVASSSLGSSRGMLQQLLDEKAAGLVFRTLRPVCCPSCDAGLDARAFVAAGSSGSCALCGTEHVDGSDEDIRIEDLKVFRAACRFGVEGKRLFLSRSGTCADAAPRFPGPAPPRSPIPLRHVVNQHFPSDARRCPVAVFQGRLGDSSDDPIPADVAPEISQPSPISTAFPAAMYYSK